MTGCIGSVLCGPVLGRIVENSDCKDSYHGYRQDSIISLGSC